MVGVQTTEPGHPPSTDERNSPAQPGCSSSPLKCTSHLGFSLEGKYGANSPRIGMSMDLVRSNFSPVTLMIAGRWKSPSMPAHYTRNIAGAN